MKSALAAAGAVLLVCLGLFFSGRGIVIWSSAPSEKLGILKCHYFTGFGVVDRQFLYTEQGLLGRETCPRFIELTK